MDEMTNHLDVIFTFMEYKICSNMTGDSSVSMKCYSLDKRMSKFLKKMEPQKIMFWTVTHLQKGPIYGHPDDLTMYISVNW